MSTNRKISLDFSRFVSIGDSITSGYTDGALFYEGQLNAFSNLMAKQFKLMGGGIFKQPLLNPESVGVGFYGNSRLVFKTNVDPSDSCLGIPKYVSKCGDLSAFVENVYEKQGPFHNMSVPSAKLISLIKEGIGNSKNGTGNYNPFFTRMASNPDSASILSDALRLDPTFFTLFIGNNDVLSYASSGGTMDFITPSNGDAGIGFDKSLEEVVDRLTENGAQGAIANLADITSVPYFTVIPYDGLCLTKQQADNLNSKYKKEGLVFYEGKNPFVINDSVSNANSIRQIKKGELIILEIQLNADKDKYLKAELPIPKCFVLTLSEISKINNALNSYNDFIKHVADQNKLAFVDVNSFTKSLKPEIIFDELTLCTCYHEDRIFSLDGLHLNAKGQLFLANIFIKAINAHYSCSIPFV